LAGSSVWAGGFAWEGLRGAGIETLLQPVAVALPGGAAVVVELLALKLELVEPQPASATARIAIRAPRTRARKAHPITSVADRDE
jgi:hypothetical protein